ncbi:MAG: type II secretion system secretin GspD [Myxococcaceae bacterium]|nr:type II secretion system secretin GspD [Myxococcaceae bacterium]
MKTPLLRLTLLVCMGLWMPALAQERPPPGRPLPPPFPRPLQPQPGATPQPQPLQPQPGTPPQPTRPTPTQPARPGAPAQPGEQQIGPRGERENGGRPVRSCEEARRRARFGIYFDKVEIEKLIQTVADATCKTFILPENVRGRVSIVGPENGRQEVNAEEFYRLFLAALEANGLAVYQTGPFLKIIDKRAAKQNPIPTIGEGDEAFPNSEQMITKLFKVKNVDLEPLRGVLQQLVTKDGDTIPYPPDTLIINDTGTNMRRLERIIQQLDQPAAHTFVRVVQVQYASAQEVAATLQKIFEQRGARPGQTGRPGQARPAQPTPPAPTQSPATAAPGVEGEGAGGPVTVGQIIADERTNKLIIAASPAAFERIEALIREIDVPISGEGRINVYYLENASAEDLAGVLQSLAQGTSARPTRLPAGAPAGVAAGAPGARATPTATELFAGEVKITADKATNSLVIIASQGDYRNIIRVIEKLDIPQRQVFVEAVIMEVNLNRTGQFGIGLHTGVNLNTPAGPAPGVIGTNLVSGSGLPPSLSIANLASFGGFLAGLTGPAIPALQQLGISIPQFGILLHALQTSSDVNVLSTPHILTSNNEEAEITVGQNVPFQAGFAPQNLGAVSGPGGATGQTPGVPGLGGLNLGSLGLGSFFAPISRQNVELKLTVKPQINEGDMVRLAVSQQTEEIASRDPVLGPTTSKRSIKTTVSVRDQETVVLGGIMQDRNLESVRKVPLLGDIPLLGYLFRDSTNEKVKTNLLIFLTPYIIRDSSDFRRIFERKLAERQQFVEQFYGQLPGYDVELDFTRKVGPVMRMNQTITRESAKLENGGPGLPGEKLILPGTSVSPLQGTEGTTPEVVEPPAEGAPGSTPPGGVEGAPAEGATPPNGSSPELRPPPEQERLQPGSGAEDRGDD